MENAIFPLEIFSLIIGNIVPTPSSDLWSLPDYSHDPDLLRCSVVCKAFVAPARKHLFRHIHILFHTQAYIKCIQNLVNVLETHPTLKYCIQAISCCTNYHDGHEADESSMATWNDPSFLILLRLPNLRHLSIGCTCNSPNASLSYNWSRATTFGPQMLLDHYITQASLLTLKIDKVNNLPCNSLLAAPALKNLKISDSHFQNTDVQSNTLSPITRMELSSVRNIPLSFLYRCKWLKRLKMGSTYFNQGYSSALLKSLQSNDLVPAFEHLRSIEATGRVQWDLLCLTARDAGVIAFPAVERFRLDGLAFRDRRNTLSKASDHFKILKRLIINAPGMKQATTPSSSLTWY
ncbi:hypothetical protein CVT24_012046 [Panaeolus cyanescens]|uniref:F-box domain-containing protein n=1 Tax=Panaeolus cyanescens TaxID=181874 RepID=A0A409YNF3_9AGAR|nr:hypothetical protein CVT24_012046 [Panaeolus cyanescens]